MLQVVCFEVRLATNGDNEEAVEFLLGVLFNVGRLGTGKKQHGANGQLCPLSGKMRNPNHLTGKLIGLKCSTKLNWFELC